VRWAGRAPGWRWLLAHELRLGWRGTSHAAAWFLAAILVLFWIAAHFGAYFGMRLWPRLMTGTPLAIAGAATWFAMFLIAATAFALCVIAIFERGDLDLLLSSPIPPRTVLAVRGIAIAVQSLGIFAVLWIPFANGAVVNGRWQALASYPVMAAMGLGAAAAAFAATLTLVRALGVRRAKTAAQVLGALVGAGLFLVMQSFNFLPRESQRELVAWSRGDAAQSLIGPDSLLWWPFLALMGDPLPAIAVMVVGLGGFCLVIVRAERTFLAGTREVVAAPARRAPAAGKFRSGLARIVFVKELRLIVRDPRLITQMLLQVLYLLPLFFVLARKGSAHMVLGPTIVLVAASLAGNLAWMTVSGEESPDLVGSAPVSKERVLWLKVAAALAIPLALCAPFAGYYATLSAGDFASFTFCLAGAFVCAAVVQIWTAKPGSPRDLRKRAQASKLVNLVEFFSAAGWAAACYLFMRGWWYWAVPCLGLGLLAPLTAWLVGRARRQGT
jgi:ABC-2 type transport system permease protein